MSRYLQTSERLLTFAWLFGPSIGCLLLAGCFGLAGLGALAVTLGLVGLALAAVGFSRL